jgi:Phage portal protein, SPP1 Gp6-like/Domain of unknown function (DUF4055)
MALTLFRRQSPQPATRNSELVSAEALSARLRARDGERLRRYRELLDFYEGTHFVSTRRGRTNLVVNYARAVVDKGVSYLFGRGVHLSVPSFEFQVPSLESAPLGTRNSELGTRDSDLAEALLGQLAEDNDLDLLLLQAATNAAVLGDAVLKVFVESGTSSLSGRGGGRVRLVNIDPFNVFPTWAGDDLTLREVALTGRISVAEAAERYGPLGALPPDPRGFPSPVLSGGLEAQPPVATVEIWSDQRYRLVVGSQTVHDGPNPYGFIPFVHVPNLQPPNSRWGQSDLLDLIPLNRELNERMSDQADVIRYHADPPVVFRGVEEHSDLPVGPGTVWDLPRDADVTLLEWRGNVPTLQEHIDRVLRALYEVTETPRTSFGDSGRLLSGVALETELQPLVQRTLRKRVSWTAALRRCNQMLLMLAERVSGLAPGAFAPYRSQIVWPPMLPRDDEAEARRNLALVAGRLRSHTTAIGALGDLDPEAELQRVIDDNERVASAEFRAPRGPGAQDPELGTRNSGQKE